MYIGKASWILIIILSLKTELTPQIIQKSNEINQFLYD